MTSRAARAAKRQREVTKAELAPQLTKMKDEVPAEPFLDKPISISLPKENNQIIIDGWD